MARSEDGDHWKYNGDRPPPLTRAEAQRRINDMQAMRQITMAEWRAKTILLGARSSNFEEIVDG